MNEQPSNEPVEDIDDVEGHFGRARAPRARSASGAETDDVEGHVQPPRDLDIER